MAKFPKKKGKAKKQTANKRDTVLQLPGKKRVPPIVEELHTATLPAAPDMAAPPGVPPSAEEMMAILGGGAPPPEMMPTAAEVGPVAPRPVAKKKPAPKRKPVKKEKK